MPAKPGRDEQVFVRLFVPAYENFAWVGSRIDPFDEQFDGAPEALITRADGQTMAIEHTLIQPFQNEMTDLASFEPVFRRSRMTSLWQFRTRKSWSLCLLAFLMARNEQCRE